jgi:hypothetical protein
MLREPSEATFRSIDRHRDALAKVRGTTRNAVDQMMVGNSHDAYVPFRERFQQECLAKCEVQSYLDDLEAIRNSFASGGVDLAKELTLKLEQDCRLSTAILEAITDGMDYEEAKALIRIVPALQDTLDRILTAAYRTAGENLREFAKERVNGRKAA